MHPALTGRSSAGLGRSAGRSHPLVAAYWACYAVVLVLLPLGGVLNWAEVAAALALQLALGLVLTFARPLRSDGSRIAGVIGIIGYLSSVALLQDGAVPTAGFAPLVLLPVLWASLNNRRLELIAAVLGLAAVYLLPEVVVGPPHYSPGGWRAGILFVVLSLAIGVAGSALIRRISSLVGQLDAAARTDELTGLANRRAWGELLDHELATARRTGRPLAVALLDLDGFKRYNDTYGHPAGDRLLRAAAAAWRGVLRDTDLLARWGGDEFGVLLPNCDAQQAQALIGRMRGSCPAARFSAGIVEWDRRSASDAILAAADRALYQAKATPGKTLPHASPLSTTIQDLALARSASTRTRVHA